jgi:hypothetical protein
MRQKAIKLQLCGGEERHFYGGGENGELCPFPQSCAFILGNVLSFGSRGKSVFLPGEIPCDNITHYVTTDDK